MPRSSLGSQVLTVVARLACGPQAKRAPLLHIGFVAYEDECWFRGGEEETAKILLAGMLPAQGCRLYVYKDDTFNFLLALKDYTLLRTAI